MAAALKSVSYSIRTQEENGVKLVQPSQCAIERRPILRRSEPHQGKEQDLCAARGQFANELPCLLGSASGDNAFAREGRLARISQRTVPRDAKSYPRRLRSRSGRGELQLLAHLPPHQRRSGGQIPCRLAKKRPPRFLIGQTRRFVPMLQQEPGNRLRVRAARRVRR